jgi:hypothetical protein
MGAPCGVPLPLSLFTVVRRLFPLSSVSSTAISNHALVSLSIAAGLGASDAHHHILMPRQNIGQDSETTFCFIYPFQSPIRFAIRLIQIDA